MPVDNLPGERIESLVDELEGIIEEARPPFGKGAQQKIIETDVFFNILDEIRMSYPEEWQKSRRIIKEREELLATPPPRRTPSSPMPSSRRSPSPLSRRLCVLPSSRPTISAIVPTSMSARTRYAAEDYAEQVFTHLEENLKSLTGTVSRCRQQLDDSASQNQGQGW